MSVVRLKKLLAKLLGGRPMTLVGPTFRDCVNGRMVNYYIDSMGNPWLAHSAWSLFRVTPNYSYEIWRD